ncbi:MAG: hypothetical protein BMS9Abin23_0823 [Thermodesulfobacteriota bacterium]|nr:MAG: hypothetical protein BMS9Abin23_0823 [Thermodesulfobacteriota bacterium]
MSLLKKTLAAFLLLTFVFTFATRAFADEMMERTLRSAIYGGVIGGLIGSAVVLLTDNPDDHLAFIPSGAAIGILVGTAYGIATSGVIEGRAFGEVEDGEFNLNIPSLKTSKTLDVKTNQYDVVQSVDLFKFRF